MSLLEQLVDKAGRWPDAVPVWRIAPPSLEAIEASAARFAASLADIEAEARHQVERDEGVSDILLAEGVRARAYHASGAIAARLGLPPMEAIFEDMPERERLTDLVADAAKRLGFDRLIGRAERLHFERLWQIKAGGMSSEGERGRDVLCRAVGAFRRYIEDIPVWGRASAFVEVAGDGRASALGVDWRAVEPEPLDRVKVLAPEVAARAVLGELAGRMPGREPNEEDYAVAGFDFGYFSLPKRRDQGVFAPVYAARLERRGWASSNAIIVVGGSETRYASICRIPVAPPDAGPKARPGLRGKPRGGEGWNPLAPPPTCH
jgi:hypothetical protein